MGNRIYNGAHVVGGDEAMPPRLARLGIDFYLGYLRAYRGHIIGLWRILLDRNAETIVGLGNDSPQADPLAGLFPKPEIAGPVVYLFGQALQDVGRSSYELWPQLVTCLNHGAADAVGHPAGPDASVIRGGVGIAQHHSYLLDRHPHL